MISRNAIDLDVSNPLVSKAETGRQWILLPSGCIADEIAVPVRRFLAFNPNLPLMLMVVTQAALAGGDGVGKPSG